MTRRDCLLALGSIAMLDPRVIRSASVQASFVPDIDIALTAAPAEVQILSGRPTSVWRFTGRLIAGPADAVQPVPNSYLGPTLRVARGQRVRIRFSNRLPDPSVVHWHGLDVPQSADGHPRLAIKGGADYVYEFEVTNRAGTYWYHPHPHMQTGPQVYSGLAGMFIVTDDEESRSGLTAAQDLLCVLQDRRLDSGNQLVYSTAMMDMETGFLGDRVLVNGQPKPAWSLATRAYRLRVLNGSNARIYKLAWSDGTPMIVLGTDGGLLEQPVTRRFVTLAPAQRADVWLDLGSRPVGTTLELRSEAFAVADAGLDMGRGMGMGMMGRGMGAGRGAAMSGPGQLALGAPISLLSISVARREGTPVRLPARLSAFHRDWQPSVDTPPIRRVPISFEAMEWKLAGRTFEMDAAAPDETVKAGSTHVWEFVNAGGPMGMQMAHPIHLHGRQFRVLSRTGGSASNSLREGVIDEGWMDTVLVLPNESVAAQVRFSDHRGLFLYHCHVLEHEDMGMMRNFRII